MHSTDGKEVSFHHNGDYSGDVKIQVSKEPDFEDYTKWGGTPTWTVEIPFDDLRDLVLDYLRQKFTSRLEDAEGDELEKLLTGLYPIGE